MGFATMGSNLSQLLNPPQLDLHPFAKSIANEEGFRPDIYKDTKGNRTTGHGINIDDPVNAKLLPKDVLEGKRQLDPNESFEILNTKVYEAEKDAEKFIGRDIYNKLSPNQKQALVDMSYNMGFTS